MAYVPFSDEEQNKPETGAATTLPTTGGGGGGAAPASGGSAQPAAQGGNQGFANLTQYLGANKDQAPQVAGAVASNLGNQYTGLQGQVDTAANEAGQAVKAGSTAYDPNLVNSAVSDPSKFVQDPNNLAAWQKQYTAAYTGPTAFETSAGYGKAADAANRAKQTYQLGQTGGGYTQLLNQIEKNPTTGKTALDKSLIQADPNAGQTIQNALSPFKGIQDYLSGKATDINKQATDAAASTADASKKTKEAATGAQSSFEKDISGKLAEKTKEYQNTNDLYSKLYQTADFKPDQQTAKDFGTSTEDMANLYGSEQILQNNYGQQITPASYLNYTAGNAPTKEGVSTPEQMAQSAALSKLTGGQSYLNPNATEGAYKAPSVSFDSSKASTALSKEVQTQDKQLLASPPPTGFNADNPAAMSQLLTEHGGIDRNSPSGYSSGFRMAPEELKIFKKYADAAIRQGKLKLDPNTYLPIGQGDAMTPPSNPNLPPGSIGFGGPSGIY